MKKSSIKIKRINSLIKKTLLPILQRYIPYHKEIITITDVKTLFDLSETNIYVLTYNDDSKIVDDLNKVSYKIRADLAKKIKLSRMPCIYFFYDFHILNALSLDNVLDKL